MNGNTSVGITSTLVRPEDWRRISFEAVNDSDTTIYLGKGQVAINTGATILPGGSYSERINPLTAKCDYKGAYCAISSVAAKNLSWIEEYAG